MMQTTTMGKLEEYFLTNELWNCRTEGSTLFVNHKGDPRIEKLEFKIYQEIGKTLIEPNTKDQRVSPKDLSLTTQKAIDELSSKQTASERLLELFKESKVKYEDGIIKVAKIITEESVFYQILRLIIMEYTDYINDMSEASQSQYQ